MWSHFLFSLADLKKYNIGERHISPIGIDKFCKLSDSEWRYVAYCHPNILCKVFPEGIDELHVDTSVVEILALVTKSKVARLDKLIKINKANVARQAKVKISSQVL